MQFPMYVPFIAVSLGITALIIFLVWLLFSEKVKRAIFRAKAPKRFSVIFGERFEKDTVLFKALQVMTVNVVLETLARKLKDANDTVAQLSSEAAMPHRKYQDFWGRYQTATSTQKVARRNYELARDVAQCLQFETKKFSDYV